jgi:3-oxoacyl-[acyl-carrier protein] reductase
VIAETLAAEGVIVAVTDIRQDLLDGVTAQWEEHGWLGTQLLVDVRKADDCNAAAAAVERDFGQIDILVNNAGIAGGARVESIDDEVWQANLDVNLGGVMKMCRAVIPGMKRRKSGRILNAASFAAIIPSVGGAAYSASKAGVESLTRVLAGELGPYDITVNAYAPGMIPTEMNHFAERPDEDQQRLLDTLTLRRWGDPQDIANLLVFLSSDQAAYITGTMIDISGGKFATQMPWIAHRTP